MKQLLLLISFITTQLLYSQSCPNITATDISGNTSVHLSCATGVCVELTTNVPPTFRTTSYQVESSAYAPIIPFDQGTPLNAKTDDTFSDIIALPFNFCFYGETYNKLVISTNGFLTFDTLQAGLASNPNILGSNPNSSLPQNSIFGIMQDLIFSDTDDSEIYYEVIGSSPCRKFVINFYKAKLAGCAETSSFQIVLSEFSNEIDVIVENKPFPCTTARFKESLIGIMNASGTEGVSPLGRNAEIWQSGNESWKFSPNGNQIQPSIFWRNSANQLVGSTATINACPSKSDVYTVTLNYTLCNTNYKFTDSIDVTYDQSGSAPVINTPVNFSYTVCDNNADNTETFDWSTLVKPLITTDPTMNVKFYQSLAAAEAGAGSGITDIHEGSYVVYARVTNPKGCYSVGIVNMNITFLDKIEAIDIKKILCFDGTEDVTIDLSTIYPEMLTTTISEISNVTFYTNLADATVPNIGTSIPAIQTIIDDVNLVTYVYYVRFENAAGCYTVKKITIELRNPQAVQDQDICDFENDGEETVLLSSLNNRIAGSQPVTLSYFQNASDANNNTNAITTFQLTNTNSPAVVYARLDMKAFNGDCYRVYPITLKLIPSPFLTKESITVNLGDICDNNNDDVETYDLTQHEKDIYAGTESFSFAYYLSFNETNNTFGNSVSDPTKLSLSKNTDVYVRVSSGACFAVAKIIINFDFLPAVVIKSGTISKCDKGYDYGETYDLDDAKAGMFITAQNIDPLADMDVTYYASQEDANLGTSAISNFQTTNYNIVTFWARFQSKNTHCYSVAPIILKTYFPPKAIPSTIQVCDGNLDGTPEVNLLSQEYTDNMVSVPDPENKFMFYLTEADVLNNNPILDPKHFSPNPFPNRVWVLVENLSGCYTLPSTIDFIVNSSVPVLKDNFTLEQCDEANDGKETVDLHQFENQIYNSGSADFSYYATLEDLNNNVNEIGAPASYQYDSSVHPPIIFVKVEVAGYCPTLVKININLKNTPIFELPAYYFCPGVGIKIEPDLSYLLPTSYTWKNPAGEIISTNSYIDDIKTEGQYSLTITIDNGCEYTEYFDIIAYEVPVITQLLGTGANSYQIIANGSKKILYSMDGINWQASNIFENIPPGPVTFYVRFEDSKCLGIPKKGLSVKINNVITPNNDGYNDQWSFHNLDVFQDQPSNLKIYDRNGILIHEQSSTTRFIWNGQYNGRVLPTSSYWYIMTFPDKVLSGWILLKNRN